MKEKLSEKIFAQLRGVGVHEAAGHDAAGGEAGMLAAACQGEDRGDVLLLQTAVLGEKLVAVAVEG